MMIFPLSVIRYAIFSIRPTAGKREKYSVGEMEVRRLIKPGINTVFRGEKKNVSFPKYFLSSALVPGIC